jgi:hypothetical protein
MDMMSATAIVSIEVPPVQLPPDGGDLSCNLRSK